MDISTVSASTWYSSTLCQYLLVVSGPTYYFSCTVLLNLVLNLVLKYHTHGIHRICTARGELDLLLTCTFDTDSMIKKHSSRTKTLHIAPKCPLISAGHT